MAHHIAQRAGILFTLAASALPAQTPSRPAVRQLPTPSSTSIDVLGSLAAVRHLPSGNVLVNDQAGRRLLLLDSTLKRVAIVADSSSGANGYGARPGGLIAHRGDPPLFLGPPPPSLLLLGPVGEDPR